MRYWTTRYLFTLLIGLLILGAGSIWWIQKTTLEHRLNLMEYLANETADRVVQQNGNIGFDPFFNKMLEDRSRLLQLEKEPMVLISSVDGEILTNKKRMHSGPKDNHPLLLKRIPSEVLSSEETIQKLQIVNSKEVYLVKSPIVFDDEPVGWVFVMQNADDLKNVNQEYRLLIILLVGLGMLGWSIIYLLSRKIAQPIQEVSKAAKLVAEGNYDILLNTSGNELEINDLITSFKEMAERLMQLEKLRAELLAGVTHDLKTPITAISGLVQAVRDGVVDGEEKTEFLDITMKEIYRMQTMISDLLDFNSLSAGAVTIRPEDCNLNDMISDIVKDWVKTQENNFDYETILPEDTVYRTTDPLRLQQILINLLNNAYQSLQNEPRKITVTLTEEGIRVTDTGSGIPEAERKFIFERFFRGENKKLKVRGLGLGLPFSKMLAKALGADLFLEESSDEGSTFFIKWM
ncbi:Signal transduction histidine kinase [Bacillus sp. cl95]|nr:Signal transduction histidine kinase [Bacillus sp. UNCCL13]SFQ89996.1 Signal transduction histidine kinase [Bacillus sp. cl95]